LDGRIEHDRGPALLAPDLDRIDEENLDGPL